MGEKLAFGVLCALFVLTINWPVLLIMSDSSPTDSHWTLLTSVILSIDIPFIAAALLLDDELPQTRKTCTWFLIIGMALFSIGVVSSSLQVSPFILNPNLEYLTENVYLSAVSSMTNLVLLIMLNYILTNLIIAYDLEHHSQESYVELEVNILEQASKRSQQISWASAAIAILGLLLVTFNSSVESEACKVNTTYWTILFLSLTMVLFLLVLLLFVKRLYNKTIEIILVLSYLVIFTPISFGWLLHGSDLFKDGTFAKCNTNSTVIVLNMMVYGWVITPGVFINFGIIFVAIAWGLSSLLTYLFPAYIQALDRANRDFEAQSQQSVVSMEMYEIRPEKFNPDKFRTAFVEKEVCAVCLDNFVNEQSVVQWRGCRHLFHERCIQRWIQQKRTCPLCKTTYGTPCSPLIKTQL
mgnify:CR=1 FL=1